MASEKQLAANRANAQKSTGPRSEAGKRRSSLNAVRHGLSGQVVVLPEEDVAAFQNFSTGIVASFQPFDDVERQLAQSFASYQWRINRAATIEDNMFALGMMEDIAGNLNLEHPEVHNAASTAKTFRSDAQEFDRLSMYSQRLVNQAAKVLKQLQQLQAERQERQKQEMEEAVKIYEAHVQRNAIFDPQEIGFALPLPQIVAAFRRRYLKSPSFVAEEVRKSRVQAASSASPRRYPESRQSGFPSFKLLY